MHVFVQHFEKKFFKNPKFFILLTNVLPPETIHLLSSVLRRAMTRRAFLLAPIPKKPIAAALPQRQSAFMAHPKPCLLYVYKMLQTASPSFAKVYITSKKDTLSGVFSLWWRRGEKAATRLPCLAKAPTAPPIPQARGVAFLRKSHGGCDMPPACRQEPPFDSPLACSQNERAALRQLFHFGGGEGSRTPV